MRTKTGIRQGTMAILLVLTLLVSLFGVAGAASAVSTNTKIYVWQDMDDDGIKDTCLGSIVPYSGAESAVDNYNYYSWSAHPINGPTPVGYESKMYLYSGSDGLSFAMFHDVDGGGSPDNIVKWDIDVSGADADVLLSDDDNVPPHELIETSVNHFEGDCHYWLNTDGGIIGYFDEDQWEIVITPEVWGDIQTWDVYSGDGTSINLDKAHKTYLVKDVTPPDVWCEEAVNPHGKNIPGEKRSDNAKSKAKNPDGFYQLFAEDICDAEPEIYVGTVDDPYLFGPFTSGIVVKITEAPGAEASMKKIGSSNGQAGAVLCHITLPSDPVITAVDAAGNTATCTGCLVPPSPK